MGITKTQANKQAKDHNNNQSQNPSCTKIQNKALEQNQIIKSIWCGLKRAQMTGVTSHLEGGKLECFGSNEISLLSQGTTAGQCDSITPGKKQLWSRAHSPVNRHPHPQLWWHQKTWEPGLPCIPLLIARKVTHFLLPRCRTIRYQPPPDKRTPRAQHCDSFRAENVCCHPFWFNKELSVGDSSSLTLFKGKGWTTPPFTNKDVLHVFSFLSGIFPILKIQARKGKLALCWSTKSWHELSVFPGEKWHVTSVQTRGCCILHAHAPLHWPALGFLFSLGFSHQQHEH